MVGRITVTKTAAIVVLNGIDEERRGSSRAEGTRDNA
jgi:hypothetical protein